MTQIEMSEPFNPRSWPTGLKLKVLTQATPFFGHWKLEFGYCLLFDNWCLGFSP
jgi:hypothetical protein